jgi:hypothetical protein
MDRKGISLAKSSGDEFACDWGIRQPVIRNRLVGESVVYSQMFLMKESWRQRCGRASSDGGLMHGNRI